MVEQEPEKGITFFFLQLDDPGRESRVNEESLLAGDRVNADDWVLRRVRRSVRVSWCGQEDELTSDSTGSLLIGNPRFAAPSACGTAV